MEHSKYYYYDYFNFPPNTRAYMEAGLSHVLDIRRILNPEVTCEGAGAFYDDIVDLAQAGGPAPDYCLLNRYSQTQLMEMIRFRYGFRNHIRPHWTPE